MSKLADLRSKGTKIILSNGLELEIKPMTLSNEADIAELQSTNQVFKAISLMVKSALKTALPDATEEEIDNINKEDLKVITEAVLKVNGLKGDVEKKSVKTSPMKKE